MHSRPNLLLQCRKALSTFVELLPRPFPAASSLPFWTAATPPHDTVS